MQKWIGALVIIGLMAAGLAFVLRPQAPPEQVADTLFFNGKIVTMARLKSGDIGRASALAIKDGHILKLGMLQSMESLTGPQTTLIDLEGGALYPGFIEAHAHPLFAATFATAVDVAGFRYDTMDKVLAQLRAAAVTAEPDAWIFAFGFDPVLVRDYAPLTRHALDEIAPLNPVFVIEQMMHKGYANSAALAAAKLDETSVAPKGSWYGRDEEGALDGAIVETPAMLNMVSAMPSVPREGYRYLLEAQYARFRAHGYTTVVDMGEQAQFSDPYDLLAEVAHGTASPLRLRLFVDPHTHNALTDTYKNDARVSLSGVKLWVDGSPYAGGMAMDDPYMVSDITHDRLGLTPQSRGALNYEDSALSALVSELHAAGVQIAMHVQGERAVEQALNAIEAAQKAYPRADARHRLEHNALITQSQMERAAAAGVGLSFFTNHVRHYGAAVRDAIIGPERAKRFMPAGQAMDAGAVVTIHSDAPASPLDSLKELQTAVMRLADADGSVIGAKGALTPEQALEAVTTNAAWQIFAEEEIGTLEKGKRADIVWLSADPLTTPIQNWHEIEVRQVWIDGVGIPASP